MQVKKFEAPTLQEALDTVKRELGPEAIILQTKTNKRGFGLMNRGSIEVTAAVSDRSLTKKKFTEGKLPEDVREKVNALPAAKQAKVYEKGMDAHLAKAMQGSGQDQVQLRRSAAPVVRQAVPAGKRSDSEANSGFQAAAMAKSITQRRYADITDGDDLKANPQSSMQEELKLLKQMVQELKISQEESIQGSGAQALMGSGGRVDSALSVPALHDAFEQLVLGGMDRRYALNVVRKVQFELGPQTESPDAVLDAIAGELIQNTRVRSLLEGIKPRSGGGEATHPQILALVGPTGVGKTTTLAKIAAEGALRRGLKVGLVNLDTYKVAAFDQLATYAKILQVPFRSAGSLEDLRAAIADFDALDLILIDTTGRSPKDQESLASMKELLSHVDRVRHVLVLAATTRDTELYDAVGRYSVFRPESLILSKLDEASLYGSLYNVAQRSKMPLTYFTTGQRVPEDLEEATPERLAALVLDLK